MKTVVAIAVLFASSAFAQRLGFGNAGFGNVVFPGSGHPPFVFNQPGFSNSGFGNVVFPGTGHPPVTNPFTITNPGFASRLGNVVGGRPPGRDFDRGRRNNFVYVPFAYPVYTGGYYPPYPPPDEGQGGGGNVTVVYPPQAAPVTIINQIPGTAAPAPQAAPPEGAQSYQAPDNTAQQTADNTQSSDEYYLIAFKDHSIYPAMAYWVEGDTLHYFTKGNVHNQVSLTLVDKPLTERLNSERSVTMHLP